MKKVISIFLIILSVLLVTGCVKGGKVKKEKPSFGNCNVFDCIDQLNTSVDLEEANKIIGFKGELLNEGTNYKTYKWYIDNENNEAVQVVFYANSSSISITFSDKDIMNSKIDFSKYNEIKEALNNKKTLKYKDIVDKFKAEGTLIEKTSTTNKYRWVKENGRYINATFNNTTGACTMIFGMI